MCVIDYKILNKYGFPCNYLCIKKKSAEFLKISRGKKGEEFRIFVIDCYLLNKDDFQCNYLCITKKSAEILKISRDTWKEYLRTVDGLMFLERNLSRSI